jgi:CheY-like chemotaxis protein
MSLRQIDLVKVYAQKHCLVVDDMPEIRVMLVNMLRVFGVEKVDTAANGEQVKEMCEENHYDMILCDYNLGTGMDGQQVLEELRFRNRLDNIDIFIMITAESSREMVLGALEYQPDDYVTKPINSGLLKTRLDKIVLRNRELLSIKKALDEKEYEQVIACCDERLNANSLFRNSCLQIKAEMCLRLGNFKQAQELFQQVLNERPVAWAKLGLGKATLLQKDYEVAEKNLLEVIAEDRRYVEAHDLLADVYLATGKNTEAQAAMQEAADLSPKSVFRQRRLATLAKLNASEPTSDSCRKKFLS